MALLVFASALAARAETGVTEKEILIGSCAPLSGPQKDIGQAELAGAGAYIDYVNRELGGVHGRRIRIISYDDKFNPDEAIACFNRLVSDGVFATSFIAGAATGIKYMNMAETDRVPLIGIASGTRSLYDPLKRYVFSVRATYDDETREETDHLWDDAGVRSIALVYQNSALGAAAMDGVVSSLSKRGAQLVSHTPISAAGTESEVEEAVRSLQTAHPEAVILALSYATAADVVRKAKAAGVQSIFVLTPSRDAYVEKAGAAADGTIWALLLPPPSDQRRPAVRLFRKLMAKYGAGSEAGIKQLEGFVHAMILVEALKRAGPEPTREKLISAVESLHDVDLELGKDFTLHFSPTNHQGFKRMLFEVIRGQKPLPLKNWATLRAKR